MKTNNLLKSLPLLLVVFSFVGYTFFKGLISQNMPFLLLLFLAVGVMGITLYNFKYGSYTKATKKSKLILFGVSIGVSFIIAIMGILELKTT